MSISSVGAHHSGHQLQSVAQQTPVAAQGANPSAVSGGPAQSSQSTPHQTVNASGEMIGSQLHATA